MICVVRILGDDLTMYLWENVLTGRRGGKVESLDGVTAVVGWATTLRMVVFEASSPVHDWNTAFKQTSVWFPTLSRTVMLVSGEGCVSRAEIPDAQIPLPDYVAYQCPIRAQRRRRGNKPRRIWPPCNYKGLEPLIQRNKRNCRRRRHHLLHFCHHLLDDARAW